MPSVDNRVVSMQFDNARFEQKLADTMKSLDKLKSGLDMAGAKNGLQEISAAADKFHMNGMSNALDGISAKFLALSAVAVNVLSNIVFQAVDAGRRMLSSFTVAPITDGFREFETNMNSIQTILANTKSDGSTLSDVNAALDELNEYSDKTIYNFSEMARNIGTFTAAGVNLDDSTNAIKGIANLAAISGSNSQQASTAMYQLSQALAAGKVNLMDWNSVVNAGMGGEVFKKALFETGKAMGTITDVPLGASFEEWEKKGGTFREQMQKGWLTADVLKTTLGAFSGELSDADLAAAGFSDTAIKEMQDLGKLGISAATEVKTFTQLLGTVKESVASGWSQSFRTIVGDFAESKKLFTGINNAIGGMVGRSAEARNKMLSDWKAFGGRNVVIESFKNIFKGLGQIIAPIREAFRELFPKKTAQDLLRYTAAFSEFSKRFKIGGETADKIKRAFSGVFSIFKIGAEIFKGFGTLISTVFDSLKGVGGGALNFAADTGDAISRFREFLVEGGAIQSFFQKIGKAIGSAITWVRKFVSNFDGFSNIFKGFNTDAVEGGVERVGKRLDTLGRVVEGVKKAWDWLGNAASKIVDKIKEAFSGITDSIVNPFKDGDYEGAIDALNVGLLAGIIVMIKKFMDKLTESGINFNFGGEIVEKLTETLDALTGKLQAMQAEIRAKALMKIATAIAILAGAVLVLSLIDSKALTKALTAMAVGFGQLMAAFALMNKLGIGAQAARLSIVAGGMILLAGAAVVLSLAVKSLSKLGWEQLAKGLLGVGVSMAIMVAGIKFITADTGGLVRAGVSMIAISLGLIVLSKAVKEFAEMDWGEMAKGLVGVGVGLGILTAATNFMPGGMIAQGVGLLIISGALVALSKVVEIFADIPWKVMGRGFLSIGAGLLIIAGTMRLMPKNLPSLSVGLLLVSGALAVMGKVVKELGKMKLGNLAKGVGSVGVMLLILAAATNAMNSAVAGAVSITIVAGALVILAEVIKTLSKLSIAQLVTSLAAIAAVLAVLGLAGYLLTPVIPSLIGLGIALGIIGAAFVLFGAGAFVIAKAFEVMAESGKQGAKGIVEALKIIGQALPQLAEAVAKAVLQMIETFLKGLPDIIKALGEVFRAILGEIRKSIPDIVKTVGAVLDGIITLAGEYIPKFAQLGIDLFTALLEGIRDNITNWVNITVDIITNFLDALALRVPEIIDSVWNLIVAIVLGVVAKAEEVVGLLVPKGREFLEGLKSGAAEKAQEIKEWFIALPGNIVTWIGNLGGLLLQKGVALIVGLYNGITTTAPKVVSFFTSLPGNIVAWVGEVGGKLIPKGVGFLTGLLTGLGQKIGEVTTFFTSLPGNIIGWIGDTFGTLKNSGEKLISGFKSGIVAKALDVMSWFAGLPKRIISAIGDIFGKLRNIGNDVIEGLKKGISEKWDSFKKWVKDKADSIGGLFKKALHIDSPSKVMMEIGNYIVEGLGVGIRDNNSADKEAIRLSNNLKKAFEQGLSDTANALSDLDEFNPTITPVLDLSRVAAESGKINSLMSGQTISADVSINKAKYLATTNQETPDTVTQPNNTPRELKFEQNIYAPTALSTNDIYRGTKSQLALAKEELKI